MEFSNILFVGKIVSKEFFFQANLFEEFQMSFALLSPDSYFREQS